MNDNEGEENDSEKVCGRANSMEKLEISTVSNSLLSSQNQQYGDGMATTALEDAEGEGEGESDEESEDEFTKAATQLDHQIASALENSRYQRNPDPKEVHIVRSNYARLLNTLKANKAELTQQDPTNLIQMVEESNVLIDRVHRTTDATLDSQFMALSAEIGAERIKLLGSELMEFGIDDYCGLMRDFLKHDFSLPATANVAENNKPNDPIHAVECDSKEATEEKGEEKREKTHDGDDDQCSSLVNWAILGKGMAKYWKGIWIAPHYNTAIHAICVEQEAHAAAHTETTVNNPSASPTKRPRQSKNSSSTSHTEPATQPTIIDKPTSTASSQTTVNVKQVYEQLIECEPLPLMRFICDPFCFGKSVENLYYFSFLVNEGRAGVREACQIDGLDDDGKYDPNELIVYLKDQEDDEEDDWDAKKDTDFQEKQLIINLTMAIWRSAIAKYSIKKPLINLK